ncbi:MAG: hypothetical protein AUJ49_12910 [Desulfovibrionaceae bacterium CG1_02_65_16]|nr:MAG: hypothetical protein AUJ49_12910 [Desulfovibrionaceae bacterium CG1_02_65_16]
MGKDAPAVLPAGPGDRDELLAVWEASARATHGFLSEADIQALTPLVRDECLGQTELLCVRAGGSILAFMGVAGERLEMLFVRPDCFRRGVGALLLRHAVRELGVRELDVNEQNPDTLAFYLHMGFAVVGRSPVDGQGRAFPLLTLRLPDQPR